MRNRVLTGFAALLFAGASVLAAGAASTKATHQTASKTAKTVVKVEKVKGTVQSLTTDQLSIKTIKGQEESFTLQTSTKKMGDLAVGSPVTVWYTEQHGMKDATRVVVASHRSTAHKTTSSSTKTTSGSMSNAAMSSSHPSGSTSRQSSSTPAKR